MNDKKLISNLDYLAISKGILIRIEGFEDENKNKTFWLELDNIGTLTQDTIKRIEFYKSNIYNSISECLEKELLIIYNLLTNETV